MIKTITNNIKSIGSFEKFLILFFILCPFIELQKKQVLLGIFNQKSEGVLFARCSFFVLKITTQDDVYFANQIIFKPIMHNTKVIRLNTVTILFSFHPDNSK